MHISPAVAERRSVGVSEMLLDNPVHGTPKTGAKRMWTNKEVEIVRQSYPGGGMLVCLSLLPGRTASSIYNRAGLLGLLRGRPGGRVGVPKRIWSCSPEMERVIRAAFERKKTTRQDFKLLARTIGRPYEWLMKRGARLTNLARPRFKAPEWTAPELDILQSNPHLGDAALQRRLARGGYTRSKIAIVIKLKRLGTDREDPHHYNANSLAKLFGVDRKTVGYWIVQGWLNAARRNADRNAASEGYLYWIHWKDVKRFIIENANVVDLRKVDPTWFIDLIDVRKS